MRARAGEPRRRRLRPRLWRWRPGSPRRPGRSRLEGATGAGSAGSVGSAPRPDPSTAGPALLPRECDGHRRLDCSGQGLGLRPGRRFRAAGRHPSPERPGRSALGCVRRRVCDGLLAPSWPRTAARFWMRARAAARISSADCAAIGSGVERPARSCGKSSRRRPPAQWAGGPASAGAGLAACPTAGRIGSGGLGEGLQPRLRIGPLQGADGLLEGHAQRLQQAGRRRSCRRRRWPPARWRRRSACGATAGPPTPPPAARATARHRARARCPASPACPPAAARDSPTRPCPAGPGRRWPTAGSAAASASSVSASSRCSSVTGRCDCSRANRCARSRLWPRLGDIGNRSELLRKGLRHQLPPDAAARRPSRHRRDPSRIGRHAIGSRQGAPLTCPSSLAHGRSLDTPGQARSCAALAFNCDANSVEPAGRAL